MAKIKLPEAEMLCDQDGELWTVYVRGHVPIKKFDAAFWELMRCRFQDAHERFEETGEKYVNCVVEHLHLRPTRFDDGDMGQCYNWCKPSAKTGFPVTAIRFGNGTAARVSPVRTLTEAGNG